MATNFYGAHNIPDVVANLRVDQAWGSAQLSAAAHEIRLNRFAATVASDTWGYAIGGGIEIKTPSIAPGDSISLQSVWARGAVKYSGLVSVPWTGHCGSRPSYRRYLHRGCYLRPRRGRPDRRPVRRFHRCGWSRTSLHVMVGERSVPPLLEPDDLQCDLRRLLEVRSWCCCQRSRYNRVRCYRVLRWRGLAVGCQHHLVAGQTISTSASSFCTRDSESSCQITGGCGIVPTVINAQNWQGKSQDIWSGLFRVRRNF